MFSHLRDYEILTAPRDLFAAITRPHLPSFRPTGRTKRRLRTECLDFLVRANVRQRLTSPGAAEVGAPEVMVPFHQFADGLSTSSPK